MHNWAAAMGCTGAILPGVLVEKWNRWDYKAWRPVSDYCTTENSNDCILSASFELLHVNKTLIILSAFLGLLPCDALRCTVFVIVILSVCLSVCPSDTLVDCVHMVRPTIVISSPYGSPIILVSGHITFIPKFEGGHPERGR